MKSNFLAVFLLIVPEGPFTLVELERGIVSVGIFAEADETVMWVVQKQICHSGNDVT